MKINSMRQLRSQNNTGRVWLVLVSRVSLQVDPPPHDHDECAIVYFSGSVPVDTSDFFLTFDLIHTYLRHSTFMSLLWWYNTQKICLTCQAVACFICAGGVKLCDLVLDSRQFTVTQRGVIDAAWIVGWINIEEWTLCNSVVPSFKMVNDSVFCRNKKRKRQISTDAFLVFWHYFIAHQWTVHKDCALIQSPLKASLGF